MKTPVCVGLTLLGGGPNGAHHFLSRKVMDVVVGTRAFIRIIFKKHS